MATIGTFFELGGRGVMEALGNVGLDYVIIDTEHGPFSEESVADYILAAERHDLLPYVRIGDTCRPSVLRMADIGARGLIVPNVRSLDQVKEVVDAAKFPPIGERGFCPNRTSTWGTQDWASKAENYMAESNARIKVIPQCETLEALEQIEDMAALPEVDGVFVGPFDLSIGMGIPLQTNHPRMEEAITRILTACKTAGKESYIFANSVEDARFWAEHGFDSIAYRLDASVFIDAYKNDLSAIRG